MRRWARPALLAVAPRNGRSPLSPGSGELDLATGPWLPGWALRVVVLALGVALLAAAGTGGGPGTGLIVAAALVGVLLRADGWAALVLAGTGAALLVSGRPSALELAALVAGVHLLTRLAAVAARAGWTTRVEWAVLGLGWRDALPAQLLGQALAVLVDAVGRPTGDDAAAWRVLALVAAGLVVVLALPRPLTARWRDRG